MSDRYGKDIWTPEQEKAERDRYSSKQSYGPAPEVSCDTPCCIAYSACYAAKSTLKYAFCSTVRDSEAGTCSRTWHSDGFKVIFGATQFAAGVTLAALTGTAGSTMEPTFEPTPGLEGFNVALIASGSCTTITAAVRLLCKLCCSKRNSTQRDVDNAECGVDSNTAESPASELSTIAIQQSAASNAAAINTAAGRY